MAVDLGALYREARLRIAALASDEVGHVPVPATPLWDVHDVVAHLAGVVEDVSTGNMAGMTTDPWTAAQVERGKAKTVARLLGEWGEGAPLIEGFLSSPAGETAARAVFDIHTHEADLLGALGKRIELPPAFLGWMEPLLMDDFAQEVAAGGLAPVAVETTQLEFFRGRLGRRTADEVRAYGWSRDPEPYLDLFFIFGRAEEPLGERT